MKIIEGMKRIKELSVKLADLQQKVSLTCANMDIEAPLYADPKQQVRTDVDVLAPAWYIGVHAMKATTPKK